jgi:hypothetical protein
MTDDLAIFDIEEDVQPSRTSNPRLLPVIGALVGGGLLLGIAASVIVAGVASVSPAPMGPGSVVCAGDAICNDLTLDELRSLTSIPFADDAIVSTSSYAETGSDITVRAIVVLADGGANPFDDSPYVAIPSPRFEWDTEPYTVLDYYAASGEGGTLYGEAVHAIDDRVRELVLVEVVRTLE